MSKPNPLYKDEKELADLIAKRDSFKFSEPINDLKSVALIAGLEGSGKTHLACTMSEIGPVYLIDTEYRAQIVTRKFPSVKFKVVKDFSGLVVAIKHIVKYQEPGTIVIDSGSDLQTFAEIAYLERTKMEKVYPIFNWSEVWAMCNALIDEIRFSQRFNLVVTARVKDEYIGNINPHITKIPRVYQTLPYKSDVILQYDKTRTLQVTKNGFLGDHYPAINRDLSLPQIIKMLSQVTIMSAQNPATQLKKAS